MKRSIARWTTALAAAALIGLPSASQAQTPASTPPPAAQTPASPTPTTQTPATSQQPATGQVDQNAAKQHLSAARETLAQLSQMPEATKLSGESRTQVSQLISNFNELITTQADWRAAYAKVDADLTALIGPASGDESAPPPAATGAVGTTGSTAAQLDPAIKAKLQDVRQDLKAFEQASGGAASTPSGAESSPNPSANPSAMPSATPTTPSATPTPSSPAATSASAPAQANPEVSKHIDAISAIVDQALRTGAAGNETAQPTGTSGGAAISIDRTQLEQIKMHLDQIRQLLGTAGGQ